MVPDEKLNKQLGLDVETKSISSLLSMFYLWLFNYNEEKFIIAVSNIFLQYDCISYLNHFVCLTSLFLWSLL